MSGLVVPDVAEERSLSSQLIQRHVPEELNLQNRLRNLKSRKDRITCPVSLPTKGNQQQNPSVLNWKLATTKTNLVEWTEGNPRYIYFTVSFSSLFYTRRE